MSSKDTRMTILTKYFFLITISIFTRKAKQWSYYSEFPITFMMIKIKPSNLIFYLEQKSL